MAASLVLSGCAKIPHVLQYGVENTPPQDVAYWPDPPDIARYRFAGQLTGQSNFVPKEESAGFLAKLASLLTGLGREKGDQLIQPQSGFVDDQGRIFVTDVGQSAVFVFDEKNGELETWRQAGMNQTFMSPIGITQGQNGEVLVADAGLKVVIRLSSDGTPVGTIGEGVLSRPTGITRDAESRLIYVADTHGHDIKIFDDFGALIDLIGVRGEEPGQFNFPTHLAFKDGRLYVTDTMNTRIQTFDSLGESIAAFGQRGLYVGNMVRPKGVALDSDNNIYVIESYNDHLLIYNQQGKYLLPIGGTGKGLGEFYLPGGVWVDDQNRVFVADTFNGRVVIFQYLGGE